MTIKRPWFQLHLSTAVMLMFVAGGIMFVNFAHTQVSQLPGSGAGGYKWITAGWPWVAYSIEYGFNEGEYVTRQFEWGGVLLNCVIAFDILFAAWFLFEWRINRQIRKVKLGQKRCRHKPS